MPHPLYRLETLGPARLRGAQGETLLGPGLPTGLLAYLLIQGRPLGRDHLAALFWPRRSRGRALQSLRQLLLRVRTESRRDLITDDGGFLALNKELLTSDLDEFHAALRAGRLADALGLWRGLFLEGFRRPESWELEDWLETTRTTLSGLIVQPTVDECAALLDENRAHEAEELLQCALAVLGEDEVLLTQAVQSASALGDGAGAFERLTRLQALDPEEDLSAIRASVAEAYRERPRPKPVDPTPVPASPVQDTPDGEPPPPDRSPLAKPARHRWRWLHPAPLVVFALVALALVVTRHRLGARSGTVNDPDQVLLYCDMRATDGAYAQLFRMDLDGTNKHRITEAETCTPRWAAQPGVLFARTRDGDGPWRLVSLRPDSSNPQAEWSVEVPEGTQGLVEPHMAAPGKAILDGRWLTFAATDSTGNRDIYVFDAVNQLLRRLTSWEGVDDMPFVDPVRRRVVFTSDRTGDGDLYAVSLTGEGPPERLTDHPLMDSRPWVQGDSVLFVRGRGEGREDGNMELMMLDLGNGEETALTHNTWNDLGAAWAPDGRTICWQSEELGHFESEVWTMDLATGHTMNLTDSPGRDSECMWTPRGDAVVFMSSRLGQYRVFLTTPRGGVALDLIGFDEYAEPGGFMPRPDRRGDRVAP